jgi:hypothetical protein
LQAGESGAVEEGVAVQAEYLADEFDGDGLAVVQ